VKLVTLFILLVPAVVGVALFAYYRPTLEIIWR
jgi:hypothetical protein